MSTLNGLEFVIYRAGALLPERRYWIGDYHREEAASRSGHSQTESR
jgi:hypothetical protein